VVFSSGGDGGRKKQLSGRKGINGRREFARLFEDAHRRKFDLVVFWALDRFSREGLAPTITYLQRLASCGVHFHSYTEAHLSTDNELVRDLLLALLSTLAKQESRRLSERVKAGMLRAKAEGKHVGRPRLFPGIVQQIRERIAGGESTNPVARALGIDRRTVKKYTHP